MKRGSYNLKCYLCEKSGPRKKYGSGYYCEDCYNSFIQSESYTSKITECKICKTKYRIIGNSKRDIMHVDDGTREVCPGCTNINNKNRIAKWRKNNKEKNKERQKEYNKRHLEKKDK